MRVLIDGIIFQAQQTGGISRIYSEILPRMCSMDDSLHVSLFSQGRIKQKLPDHMQIKHCVIPHIKSYLIPKHLWKTFVTKAEKLLRELWINNEKGDIWHSTYFTMPVQKNMVSVVTVFDMIHERFEDILKGRKKDQTRDRKRRCILSADAVICISDTTRRDLQQFYKLDSDCLHVVHLACSDIFKKIDHHDVHIELPVQRPFFLFLGRRAMHKNFYFFTDAYSKWRHRNEMAILVVGKAWSKDEEKHLSELGIRDQVYLLINVDDEFLCYLYNSAAAFVYPSLYEGFGIPLLEAMASGCPVIASDIPSTNEVAGECPIYFDPTEIDSLVNAFDVLLSESRDSDRVQTGLKQVKRYSWDKTAAQTLKVYHAIS